MPKEPIEGHPGFALQAWYRRGSLWL